MNSGAAVPDANRPLPDILEEAARIVDRASTLPVPVRLVGGIAIRMHAHGAPRPELSREFKDIDLVTQRRRSGEVLTFLASLGYVADHAFNTLNGSRRALFYDEYHGRQIDVFVGSFEMCHRLPIAERLELDPVTVPLAELLLTKLQIVELNEKDLRDAVALLIDHEVGAQDAETVNGAYIAKLCAGDWGLWRTCKMTIERVQSGLGPLGLSEPDRQLLTERLGSLGRYIDAEPKSRRWKMRDRVGDRVRWYEEPEEVG